VATIPTPIEEKAMQNGFRNLLPLLAVILGLSLGLAFAAHRDTDRPSTESKTQTHPDINKQRENAERQVRPEVEKQRQQEEQQAAKTLDREAIAAIQDTQRAINLISAKKNGEALSAIEQATGKINILLARNPSTALIPVQFAVDVIDLAPLDSKAISDLAQAASTAMKDKDYPAARVDLQNLMSEIRVRTSNLPLATYPDALKRAAQLLDQKKFDDANRVLLTALNTLVVVDRVTPIPLVVAKAAVTAAQDLRQKDKNTAQSLLEAAKNEVQRAKDLGYESADPEYASLDDQITNLQKQLKGNGETGSVFAQLRNKLDAFLKKEGQRDRR
jgi:hypothetical protein